MLQMKLEKFDDSSLLKKLMKNLWMLLQKKSQLLHGINIHQQLDKNYLLIRVNYYLIFLPNSGRRN